MVNAFPCIQVKAILPSNTDTKCETKCAVDPPQVSLPCMTTTTFPCETTTTSNAKGNSACTPLTIQNCNITVKCENTMSKSRESYTVDVLTNDPSIPQDLTMMSRDDGTALHGTKTG